MEMWGVWMDGWIGCTSITERGIYRHKKDVMRSNLFARRKGLLFRTLSSTASRVVGKKMFCANHHDWYLQNQGTYIRFWSIIESQKKITSLFRNPIIDERDKEMIDLIRHLHTYPSYNAMLNGCKSDYWKEEKRQAMCVTWSIHIRFFIY